MPAHTKSKSHSGADAAPKPKKGPAAGGAGKTRSAVTGRQLGRAAIRSLNKNADRAEEYLDSVLSASSLSDLQALIDTSRILARVTRAVGAGRLTVTLQTGETEVNIRISGTLRFHGSASKKTDRDNCMCVGDIILVDGGSATAKLSACAANRIKRVYSEFGMSAPAGFFSRRGDEEASADAGGDFEWDRSEEEAREAAEEAARKAEEARKAIVRAGGAGRGGLPKPRRAVTEAVEEGLAIGGGAVAVEPVAAAEEEEEFDLFADAEPEKPVVDRSAPNRAERRAAAAAARAAALSSAEEAEARAAFLASLRAAEERERYEEMAERVVILPKPMKSWEEMADEEEIDVDNI